MRARHINVYYISCCLFGACLDTDATIINRETIKKKCAYSRFFLNVEENDDSTILLPFPPPDLYALSKRQISLKYRFLGDNIIQDVVHAR